ncbi:MAG: zinc ABC transporter substrate-binding protein [Candidatus Yonathbacteria bacterium]|nr:zinc ABC transporter substrate-binding protein [Candidatus Yonathbacteria bacterium]
MNNKKNILLVLVIILLAVASLFLLKSDFNSLKSKKTGKVNIVASFYPLTFLASEVGGELVSVYNLTPAGAEPHDFEPSPRELASLRDSDLFIYNGASFEPWIQKWLPAQNIYLKHSINMVEELRGRGTQLIFKDKNIDPHIWLDPMIAREEALVIRDMLIQIDPDNRDIYSANAKQLDEKLSLLNKTFKDTLDSCLQKDVIVSHDAFGYLAQRYGLSVTSISGISPDEEPSPQEIIRIVTLAREKGIHYIFTELTANPKFAETIAREIDGGFLVLNPIESLTPNEVQSKEDYLSLMMLNLQHLKTALLCNQ